MITAIKKGVVETKNMVTDLFSFSQYETIKDCKRGYQDSIPIRSKINWADFNEVEQCFEMSDGRSVGAVFELTSLPTEGQAQAYLDNLKQGIAEIFRNDTVKLYYKSESPWYIQFFYGDDTTFQNTLDDFIAHIGDKHRLKPTTKAMIELHRQNLSYLSTEGGLFTDKLSGTRFKGRNRYVRMIVSRQLLPNSPMPRGSSPERDLNKTTKAIEGAFAQAGITMKRMNEVDFRSWMQRLFSPKPRGFASTDEWIKQTDQPKCDEEKPIGYDIVNACFASKPRVDKENVCIWLDGKPTRYIPTAGLLRLPQSGHLSAERKMSHSDDPDKIRYFAPLDHLPEGSIFAMTIVLQDQEELVKNRFQRISNKAKNATKREGQIAGVEAKHVEEMIAYGNYVFPVSMGVYLQGEDLQDLIIKEDDTSALLSAHGIKPLNADKDRTRIENFFRNLPLNYDFHYDENQLKKSRLLSLNQVASLVPLYGRSRGTGNPLFIHMNRGGEALTLDPLRDRMNNAHGVYLGTTGSGKSASMTHQIMANDAVYDPDQYIIDAGGSFQYVPQYWRKLGKEVYELYVSEEMPKYALNPYVETLEMLKQIKRLEKIRTDFRKHQAQMNKDLDEFMKIDPNNKKQLENWTKRQQESAQQPQKGKSQQGGGRDYLMEFVASSILMITGGKEDEMKKLDREDRYFILEAIKRSAKKAVEDGYEEMIASDLAEMMDTMAIELNEDEPRISDRLRTMSRGLRTFVATTLNDMWFNQRDRKLPASARRVYFELGLFKDDKEENEAPRALAIMCMLNIGMSKAERQRGKGIPTFIYVDECHILMMKHETALRLVQALKMARKIDCWIWMATQNAADFTGIAAKALAMMEFKIYLWSDKSERDKIAKLVTLSENQSNMMHSLRKQKKGYIEALSVSNQGSYLYRNVPPREVLALAMTDPEENTLREAIIEEYDCDAVEACFLMAQEMRGEEKDLAKIQKFFEVNRAA